jgi:hypothetical protein
MLNSTRNLRDWFMPVEGAPLTRHEILTRWPGPATRPTANTLWRWLSEEFGRLTGD